MKHVPIIFACQAGELEIKAGLLAASLRHVVGESVKIFAGIPQPEAEWSQVTSATQRLFEDLKVQVIPVRHSFGVRYPVANKIAALAALCNTPALLLDSDMLCTALPPFASLPGCSDIALKPADFLTFHPGDDAWKALYSAYKLGHPERRVLTTVNEKLTFPYFNAGLIYVRNAECFGRCWMSFCEAIDHDDGIANKYPWLDQIALPLAIQNLRWNMKILNERWNYPAHVRLLAPDDRHQPFFVHYHRPQFIAREPRLLTYVRELVRQEPSLGTLMETNETWREYIYEPLVQNPRIGLEMQSGASNFLITGIPRSGTSLFCRLLHDQKNTVVVNEPSQALKNLRQETYGDSLALYYAELHRDIRQGRSIENKVCGGRLITDTAVLDERTNYSPSVESGTVLLGTKNTLAYLSRLSSLRRALPCAAIFACVREPRSTIASWKRSFRHLATADVAGLVKSHVINSQGSAWELRRLEEIRDTPDVRLRRALFWRYLAMLIIEHRERVTVVSYERLTADPKAVVQDVLRVVDPARPAKAVTIEVEVRKAEITPSLEATEEQMISDICGQVAEEFGYYL